jgi:hypothetical protein
MIVPFPIFIDFLFYFSYFFNLLFLFYNDVSFSSHDFLSACHGSVTDLCHAAMEGTIRCQRTVSCVLLELAFSADIRAAMVIQPKLSECCSAGGGSNGGCGGDDEGRLVTLY